MMFNVLNDPWIPLANGEKRPLVAALAEAHALPGVQCASPMETCAVYRLMLAFVMDALALRTRDERLALLAKGAFDRQVIQAYVERCEREGACFTLFDAKRPFMQSGYDPEMDKEPKPASTIVLQMPNGNNHVFFDHSPQARLKPDEALRHLLTAYLFCTAAAQGYPSSVNNTPCVYVLHQGQNLFETLVLNAVAVMECGNIAYGRPAWREPGSVVPKKVFADVELLAALTWQPRRVTLLCGEDGLVSQLYLQQGHNFLGNRLWRDPHVPYRRLKSGDCSSLKPQQGRAFWRDLGALAASRGGQYGMPPLVVENEPDDLENCRLFLVGLVTSNAALLEQLSEEMLLPSSVLGDADRGDTLREDLAFLEDCARALQYASKDYESGVLAPVLQDTFFNMARNYVYGEYLEKLAVCESDDEYLSLRKAVHDRALKMMLGALDKERLRMGYDGRSLTAQAGMRKKALASYYKARRKREHD